MARELEKAGATVRIRNQLGLHARPAALLVERAKAFPCEIFLSKDSLEVNAKSIMGVLMLAAECGSKVTLRAEGDRAEEAVEAIKLLIKGRFGEDE